MSSKVRNTKHLVITALALAGALPLSAQAGSQEAMAGGFVLGAYTGAAAGTAIAKVAGMESQEASVKVGLPLALVGAGAGLWLGSTDSHVVTWAGVGALGGATIGAVLGLRDPSSSEYGPGGRALVRAFKTAWIGVVAGGVAAAISGPDNQAQPALSFAVPLP